MGGRAGVCLRGDDEGFDDDTLEHRSPVTQKNCSNGGPRGSLCWSVSEMQGWRETMEDAHLTIPSLREAVQADTGMSVDSGWSNVGLFGVVDGHGGFQVAKFCERHLPQAIASRSSTNIGTAMSEAFVEMDQLLKEPSGLRELKRLSSLAKSMRRIKRQSAEGMGTTAVVCCVTASTLVVANCGDSRAVLCRAGRAIGLSQDHKPHVPEERARIEEAGGWVQNGSVPRVNGDLSLSRALGDLEYKDEKLPPEHHIVTAVPEVRSVARSCKDEFLLLCCDGIWDVLSSQAAVDFVRHQLGDSGSWAWRIAAGKLKPSEILSQMLDHCLSPDLSDHGWTGRRQHDSGVGDVPAHCSEIHRHISRTLSSNEDYALVFGTAAIAATAAGGKLR
mmetsp:Transcript_4041/g.6736  ORF Transcript_4041/g.6736 Transcript_4041/m.6736 type:complete len:389 (-) Transcript_4041:103-1269(-)